MIRRSRGIAHINIMWFIVMVILFLGAVGFAYIQMQEVARLTEENQQLQAQAQKAREKLLAAFEQATKISEPVGFRAAGPGAYTQPDLVRQKVAELRELVGAGPSVKTLQEVIPKLVNLIAAQKDRIRDLETAVAAAEAARDKARQAKSAVERQLNQTLAKLRTEKADIESTLREQIKTKDDANATLRSDIRKKNEEMAKAKEAWAQERAKLKQEAEQLRIRNERARDKLALIENPEKIDGKIISVSVKLNRAFINLGRKQMVRPGMTFEVLEPKGNTYAHKAWAKVLTVDEETSEVAIRDLVDPYDPVAVGDVIRNKLYDPDVRFNFVLLGRFVEPLTKGTIKRILESMGNTVSDHVTPETDYVILGRQPVGENATPPGADARLRQGHAAQHQRGAPQEDPGLPQALRGASGLRPGRSAGAPGAARRAPPQDIRPSVSPEPGAGRPESHGGPLFP